MVVNSWWHHCGGHMKDPLMFHINMNGCVERDEISMKYITHIVQYCSVLVNLVTYRKIMLILFE